jgi:hypothetical protein
LFARSHSELLLLLILQPGAQNSEHFSRAFSAGTHKEAIAKAPFILPVALGQGPQHFLVRPGHPGLFTGTPVGRRGEFFAQGIQIADARVSRERFQPVGPRELGLDFFRRLEQIFPR